MQQRFVLQTELHFPPGYAEISKMEIAAKQPLNAQEYLTIERNAEIRSEFLDGEMFAMAGGTRRHSRIKVKLIGALEQRLSRSSCQVLDSDMRVKIEATGLYTYPDVSVACGNLRFEDEREDTLLNPKVIIEVLSDSTAAWDRGEKFWHYRQIKSLLEYVLVSQDTLIEHYTRQSDDTWLLETIQGRAAILKLKSIKCSVPLAEIYEADGRTFARIPSKKPSTKRQNKR
jgi:Uma2 family endonuclease